jgi:hypothetical protein
LPAAKASDTAQTPDVDGTSYALTKLLGGSYDGRGPIGVLSKQNGRIQVLANVGHQIDHFDRFFQEIVAAAEKRGGSEIRKNTHGDDRNGL